MIWRQIEVTPKTKTGKLYTCVRGHSLFLGRPLYDEDIYDLAYSKKDVENFYEAKKNEAIGAGYCTEKEFSEKMSDF